MNEAAVRLEEQIISLFSGFKTEVHHGWILKEMPCCVHNIVGYYTNAGRNEDAPRNALCLPADMVVYPLYCGSSDFGVVDRIRMCEEICRGKSLRLVFRIVEYTNYYLTARLEDNGYKMQCCRAVMEHSANQEACFCNQVRQRVLYLPDGKLDCDTDMENMIQSAIKKRNARIVADISEDRELLKYYEKMGFRKAYLYRCYQKTFG